MDVPKRKTLPHDVPLWVDPQQEIYFVTINCRERFDYGRDAALRRPRPSEAEDGTGMVVGHTIDERFRRPCASLGDGDSAARCPYPELGNGNQLASPEISTRIFETVRHRQNKFLWWPYLFLLMPDHLHALISFPPSGKPIQSAISKWKEWTAKEVSVVWQRDFFEHRLRNDESRRQKADYILENPVRKKLITRSEDWPFVYFADGERPQFAW